MMDWERRLVRLVWALDPLVTAGNTALRDAVRRACAGAPALRHHVAWVPLSPDALDGTTVSGACVRCGADLQEALDRPTCLPTWVQP
jgi:hypothetical protein